MKNLSYIRCQSELCLSKQVFDAMSEERKREDAWATSMNKAKAISIKLRWTMKSSSSSECKTEEGMNMQQRK